MHEAAITRALINQVQALIPKGARVDACCIEIGELEHLDEVVMQTMWRAMIEESGLRGAALEIRQVALRVRCGACGEGYEPEDRAILFCPKCGAVRPEVLQGAGVTLRSLEVGECA